MAFVKGYEQTAEQQQKAKASRLAKYGIGQCFVCGKDFPKYGSNSNKCGDKECAARSNAKRYRDREASDPLLALAYRLTGSLRMGKGKLVTMKAMLAAAMHKPCEYCGATITLLNASVDHKIPRSFSKVYSPLIRSMLYTKNQINELDKPENLHIVCRTCNQNKSDLTHDEFLTLLSILKPFPQIQANIFRRMSMSRKVYSFARRR